MRIILADHHTSSLSALRAMLQTSQDFDLIGEAVDTQELLNLAAQLRADLVLLDEDLPGNSIEATITDLHALEPSPVVVVLGVLLHRGRMALRAGADAFVSKADGPQWLQETLLQYARSDSSS